MLYSRDTCRGESLYYVLVPQSAGSERASIVASFRHNTPQWKPRRADSRVQFRRLNRWCKTLLIISFYCLPFALSGCGGASFVVGGAPTGDLRASPNAVTFGTVPIGQTARTTVSILNGGSAPVQISQLNLSGQSFSIVGQSSLPMTLAAGGSYSLNVQFNPAAEGTATGQLTVASNTSTAGVPVATLLGTGTTGAGSATLGALYCSSGNLVGSGTDACTVTLTAPAPSAGLVVNLSSSSLAVAVPSTVTVPANATSAGFTVTVSSVAAAQVVTMTASAGGISKSFTLQLNAAILALSINATNVAFGDVIVNTPATQPVTLTSTGTAPVTISGAKLTGAGFALSGSALPTTLNPNQQATLYIQFNPLAVGAATGQLTVTSNSSTNGTAVIGLSGTGTAPSQPVAVALTPATVSTMAGANQQFAVSVTGTSNAAVTWAVSGAGCSGASCGTISAAGLYTAPAKAPSPATVTITATSVADASKSASVTVTIMAPTSTTYYLAPASAGGNDSNDGLSPGSPWLSPNHAVNCGDTITAVASSSYDQANFQFGKWGTVTCSPGATASVAWLKCATFDACKLTATNQNGMWVTSSYWGVEGWEVQALGGQAICFAAYPPTSNANIHHIIFANNIANGCYGAGFQPVNNGSAGVDYFVLVGNIAYNAAQQSAQCGSGISITAPAQTDTLPGTHIYVAGNFVWNNFNPASCAGGKPTDGEGIIFDTFDANSYTQQAVIENNIAFLNGSSGFRVDVTTMAPIYIVNNTSFGNNGDHNMNSLECGEITLQESNGIHVANNIAMTNAATGCGTNPNFAFYVADSGSANSIDLNLGYSASGYNAGSGGSPTFSYVTGNILGFNPNFVNAPISNPGPPKCGSSTNVANCMATTIANFFPQASAASGRGYQAPTSIQPSDPLFPTWLCNVNLPSGLIPNHCF